MHTSSFGLPRAERTVSQDAFAVHAWDETVIAIVADGVGGARAGQEASERIVQALARDYRDRPRSWSPAKSLGEFTRLLNQRLYQDALERFGGPELVSTLCVAVLEGDRLIGLNVGDSRAYLSRGGELRRLTHDHVLEGPGLGHVLSRALGMTPEIEPHCFELELADGDVALLCTDGVSNALDEQTLRSSLARRCSARVIVTEARDRVTEGNRDDMSAVVLEIAETGRLARWQETPMAIPATLQKGDVYEGFTLLKPFQQSDRVWLGWREGQRFTLKFAPLEARTNEAVLHAFVKETWNATRLDSSYLPRAFVPPGTATRCYVMEFIEAPSLRALLRSRRLSVDEAIALGAFLLRAGQDLLRYDLVHGDVKPENILALRSYDAIDFRLVDFGSVTELFSITSRAGTPSYLAPERFHEAPISERTEIFAIGATLFEALTGVLPYGEIERFQTPRFGTAKDPARLNPNIPDWLRAVLLRATAPRPAERYANFSEMLFELENPARVTPFREVRERDPVRIYQAACAVLLLVCLGLLLKLIRLAHSIP